MLYCTGTEALYRPYGPQGEQRYSSTVQAVRLIGEVEVQLYCTGTEALYRPYGPQGEQRYSSTVQGLRLCKGRTAGGVEVQLYSFLTTALEGGEWSASRCGRSLPPRKTRYPLYRRLGWPQDRSGQVRKISPPPGFDPRNVQPVAHSLYRLSYRSHTKRKINNKTHKNK